MCLVVLITTVNCINGRSLCANFMTVKCTRIVLVWCRFLCTSFQQMKTEEESGYLALIERGLQRTVKDILFMTLLLSLEKCVLQQNNLCYFVAVVIYIFVSCARFVPNILLTDCRLRNTPCLTQLELGYENKSVTAARRHVFRRPLQPKHKIATSSQEISASSAVDEAMQPSLNFDMDCEMTVFSNAMGGAAASNDNPNTYHDASTQWEDPSLIDHQHMQQISLSSNGQHAQALWRLDLFRHHHLQ